MIPGPGRGKYHGEKHSRLDQSIVDIYRIYDSLFNIRGVVEAVLTASIRSPDNMKWVNVENPGFASASDDPLELDALLTSLLKVDPHVVGYLSLATETFGGWNEESIVIGQESGMKIFYAHSTRAV